MPSTTDRTISRPADPADPAESAAPVVASDAQPTASEAVRSDVRPIKDRDAAVDRWLREGVVPVYDAMQADPDRGIPIDQVLANLHDHHARRLKAR